MSTKVDHRSAEGKARQAEAISGDNNPAKRPEVREQIRESKTGGTREPFSQEWLDNMSEAHMGEKNGMYGKTHREDSIDIMRDKATGRKQSEETVRKKADAIRGLKRAKKLCPHCNEEFAVNTYPRFHGDNCKMNPNKIKR